MNLKNRFFYVYAAWIVNLVAMCGSLFYSNILMYPPCSLCWAQRICVYPQVLILAVGFLKKDKNVFWYSMPLLAAGLIISGYHNLLYYDFISQAISECTGGVSCTSKQVEYLGFVTIPLMSLTSLIISSILMITFKIKGKDILE